ncbi:MAG TPA: transposase [Polyangia bacterium]
MRLRYTREQRSKLVELVAGGNATVAEAATKLGVGESTAYDWVKQELTEVRGMRKRPVPRRVAGGDARPMFARLVSSAAVDVGVGIRVGGAEIQVRQGFDGELLRAVVKALAKEAG